MAHAFFMCLAVSSLSPHSTPPPLDDSVLLDMPELMSTGIKLTPSSSMGSTVGMATWSPRVIFHPGRVTNQELFLRRRLLAQHLGMFTVNLLSRISTQHPEKQHKLYNLMNLQTEEIMPHAFNLNRLREFRPYSYVAT